MALRLIFFSIFLLIQNINLSYASDTEIKEIHGEWFGYWKEKAYVPKCCPLGHYVYKKKSCMKYDYANNTLDFSDMVVYDKERNKVVSNVKESLILNPAKFDDIPFKTRSINIYRVAQSQFNLYLTEEGIFYVESPNAYDRWIVRDSKTFCLDYQLVIKEIYKQPKPSIWVVFDDEEESSKSNIYLTSAILVSCVFLLLVLVVYALLPELRNLCGLILMAYVFSLFWAFLLLAVIQIKKHPPKVCTGLTFSIYYFFLASFCWMNVMSYDIWWTFRGYAKARPIHRRGERFKFYMYCLYAFGLPLAMTAFLHVMNSIDLRDHPWIVTPFIPRHGCFIEGGEKLLYLYMPMMVLILSNWLLYLMTAFNVWRLSRGTAVLDSAAAGSPAAHRTHWNRFMVYLKLSVVMGLNWVFEVVSFLSPGFRVWNITDAYNILIGLAIFLIFVCKEKILKMLIKRFKMMFWKKDRGYPSTKSTSSAVSECSSQETSFPLVCSNPNGPVVQIKV